MSAVPTVRRLPRHARDGDGVDAEGGPVDGSIDARVDGSPIFPIGATVSTTTTRAHPPSGRWWTVECQFLRLASSALSLGATPDFFAPLLPPNDALPAMTQAALICLLMREARQPPCGPPLDSLQPAWCPPGGAAHDADNDGKAKTAAMEAWLLHATSDSLRALAAELKRLAPRLAPDTTSATERAATDRLAPDCAPSTVAETVHAHKSAASSEVANTGLDARPPMGAPWPVPRGSKDDARPQMGAQWPAPSASEFGPDTRSCLYVLRFVCGDQELRHCPLELGDAALNYAWASAANLFDLSPDTMVVRSRGLRVSPTVASLRSHWLECDLGNPVDGVSRLATIPLIVDI